MKHLTKSEKLALSVSKRFANSKQELAIQTTAGIIREAVAAKGGHNSKRVPCKRVDGKRDKKVPYSKSRWGTLVVQDRDHLEAVKGTSLKVAKQLEKPEAYKDKINSKQWKKAAGER